MKLLLKKLLSLLPTPLPLGMKEFDVWAQSVVDLLPRGLENVPFDDKRFVLASTIQRLDPTASYKPKHYFVRVLAKAAASQVAGQIFVDVKEKQKAAQEAQAAKLKQAEDTAAETASSGKDSPGL